MYFKSLMWYVLIVWFWHIEKKDSWTKGYTEQKLKISYHFSWGETVNTAISEEQDQSLVLSKQTHDPVKSRCTGRNRRRQTAACKLIHFVTYCAYYVWSTSHLEKTRNMKCYCTTTDRGLYPVFLKEAFFVCLNC